MPFHLESLWGATLMPHKGCAMDCDKTKVVKMSKTSGQVLSCLWTKVRKILPQRIRPFALSRAFARLSVSRFVQQIFAIKCRSRWRNRTNVKVFWPPFFSGGTTPTFLRHIVTAAYCWPFDKVWLSSVCWSPSVKPGNEVECGIGSVKMQVEFEAVCGPKFMKFWDDVGDPL